MYLPAPRPAAALAVATAVSLSVAMDWVPTALDRIITALTIGDRLPGSLIHGVVGLAVVLVVLRGNRWLVLAGAVSFSVMLVSTVLTWWLAYVAYVYVGMMDPQTCLAEYARNVTVLPRIADHLVVPYLQHLLIHLSVTAAALQTWRVFVVSGR